MCRGSELQSGALEPPRVRAHRVSCRYSGISATLLGVAPYAGLKFGSYEALKGLLGRAFGLDEA